MLKSFYKIVYKNLYKNHNVYKIIYILLMVFIFSIIYTFFDDNEFAGWIEFTHASSLFDIDHKTKVKIFSKYAKEYQNFLTKTEFMRIPIVKDNYDLYIYQRPSYFSESPENIKVRSLLFDVYSQDNKMSLDEFTSIPFKLEQYDEKELEILKMIDLSRKFAVTNYFDRLYYSVTIQTTLGFGDIFPASKALRFFTMLQALSTIFIIIM